MTATRRPAAAVTTGMLFARYLVVGLRQPVFGFLFPIVFPVVLVVFVRAMFQRVAQLPGFPLSSYTAYIAPGIVMLIPMIGSGYGASTLLEEIGSGFVDRLRLQGISSRQLLAAKIGFEAVRILPAGVVVIGLLAVLGAPLRAGAATAVALLALMCLWSAAYSSLFYLAAVRTLNPQAPIALLPLALPVLFVSQALMPTEFLPTWLRVAIELNPFSHVVAAAATLMYGDFRPGRLLLGTAVAAAVFVVLHLLLRRLAQRRIGL
ncbi:ABC transporter permease [Nocardia pseudobrasiliensis]|uniref:ABC-2 type transport system permease protein n=1 Tax=Nocardia pseudobrasiliensis TaxID=45979 RepID=A0A370HS03_9NOCA|nr:ABC transporter permease [Nocardia pseudobrasiliensis]RDI61307.1 ABC-2 type transport system permease protein [Nocardia pseudobrasiliensis]